MRNSRDIEWDETEETRRRTEEIKQQNNKHEAVQREQRKQEQRIEPLEFIHSNIMNQNKRHIHLI